MLAICVFTFCAVKVSAAPPPNDTCANAEVIPGTAGATSPYFTAIVPDIRSATTNSEPPLTNSCGIALHGTVWYRFQPSDSGRFTFSTALDTATTLSDTAMAIYEAGTGCASSGSLPEFKCNDDSGASHNRAAISENLVSGTVYYIVLWSAAALDTNDITQGYAVQLKVSKPTVPPNDTCAGSVVIPPNGPFPYVSSTNDNTLATTQQNPTCVTINDGTPSRDVWYQFIPQTSGTYNISTGPETATTVEDTALTIYSASTACGALTQVICNNNGSGRAGVSQALTAGTRYYIVVWDNDEEFIPGSTLVQLRISKAEAPTVTTLDAINISSIGALFRGTVNPNGLQTRYWFEWGTSPSSLNNTSQIRLILAGTTTPVAAESQGTSAGLSASQTYHFQIVSTNALGTNRGSILTFHWSNVQPALIGPAANSLTSGSYVLEFNNGNPNQLYMIQGATDLGAPSPWIDLGLATNTPSTTHFRYTHRGATAAPYRFYRARLP